MNREEDSGCERAEVWGNWGKGSVPSVLVGYILSILNCSQEKQMKIGIIFYQFWFLAAWDTRSYLHICTKKKKTGKKKN